LFDTLIDGARNVLTRIAPSPWRPDGRIRVVQEVSSAFGEPLWTDAVNRELPGWPDRIDIRFVSGEMSLQTAAREADVVSTMNLGAELVGIARQAKWMNTLLSGINLTALSKVAPGIQVTTSRGIAASSMAEHALMCFLSLRANLPLALRNQSGWRWSDEGLLRDSASLGRQTVAVFGLGAAGSAALRLFKSIGMRTIGVTRSPDADHADCDEVCALGDFNAALAKADLIVLTLALTATTRHLFGREQFQRMKPTAVLVNVSRGDLIQEEDLAQALRAGTLGGAGLDVLSQEPPAQRHPLRDCPNLILTPHVSGNIQRFRDEIAARFARNLAAFANARPLEGLVAAPRVPQRPSVA
jgi:phosphoglycerate dehydrogenase-like enzyme